MNPHLELVRLYSPDQVAALFGQFRDGNPDTRWVYRHSVPNRLLYAAARRRPGYKALLFDRAEIDRILTEFRPPE